MQKYFLPRLGALREFEAAARHQSMMKAGEELHLTRAAVSLQIRKLEQEWGCRLFERYHRRIVLTGDGQMLFAFVTTMFSELQRVVAQLSRNQRPDSLVISVDPDFAGLWLVPKLADFHAILPDTLVEILSSRGLETLDDVRIDCAIQYADADLAIENSEVLFRSNLFPVCAPDLVRKRPLRSPADLRRHVLLHDRTFVEWQQYFQSCSMTVDVKRSSLKFNSTDHCVEAAVRGQGVAIGDDFLAAIHLSEGRLMRPFVTSVPSTNAYYFVVPPRSARRPAVLAFREWLFREINHLRANSATSAGAVTERHRHARRSLRNSKLRKMRK